MRPVRRGPTPPAGIREYRDAFPDLVSSIGGYCSYCERMIPTQLAVEHVQPKGLVQYAHLINEWSNFLLGCVNCNGTKGAQDVVLGETLLPDRDNTFCAFEYDEQGTVRPAPGLDAAAHRMAARLLEVTGLDRNIRGAMDNNGAAVAADRVAQRRDAWRLAARTRSTISAREASTGVQDSVLRGFAVQIAVASGFFSVWMHVYDGDPAMRVALIAAFPGTVASGCFDATGAAVVPAPNPDGLVHGGKV